MLPDTLQAPAICFVGALPPPMQGMAAVNADVTGAIAVRADLVVIDLSPGGLRRGIRYHAVKSARAVRGMGLLLRARLRGTRLLYASVDDGWGGLWTLMFAGLARAVGMRVVLHHHSYRYIVRRRRLMAGLTTAAGRRALHVVLSDGMSADMMRLYPAITETMVAPNPVAQMALAYSGSSPDAKPLVIGMLANLTFEKGVREFIRIVQQARAEGLCVHGIMAGPTTQSPDAAAYIEAARASDPQSLSILGPVSGSAKEAFFAQLDLFVFPTQYQTEAYSLVLIEALSRGVPVVAPARGAIASLASLGSAKIVPLEYDIVSATTAYLTDLELDPNLRERLRSLARVEGPELNASNRAAQDRLVDRLCRMAVD